MAVDHCTHRVPLAVGTAALVAFCVSTACHAGEGVRGVVAATTPSGLLQDARTLVLDGASRFESALKSAGQRVRVGSPDGPRQRSGVDPFAGNDFADDAGPKFVVQQNRPDGADLMTVRYVRGNPGVGLH
jgi:hypothetical protein